MQTQPSSGESKDIQNDTPVLRGVEVANQALADNKEEIFEMEKDVYFHIGESVQEKIDELESDVVEECGPAENYN